MIDYENTKLEDLDTSGFFVDPKIPNFTSVLERKNKAFSFDPEAGLHKSKILRYIALMYDPSSELRQNIPHLPSRKRICAIIAGFEVIERKFSGQVEDMLLGKYRKINRAIVAYCFLSNNIYVVAHAAFQDMYFRAVAQSFESFDKETIANLQSIQDKLIKNEEMIFGGKEVLEMRESLYSFTSEIDNTIIPERIVKQLEEGKELPNPYPDSYIPKNLKYVGVEPPE